MKQKGCYSFCKDVRSRTRKASASGMKGVADAPSPSSCQPTPFGDTCGITKMYYSRAVNQLNRTREGRASEAPAA